MIIDLHSQKYRIHVTLSKELIDSASKRTTKKMSVFLTTVIGFPGQKSLVSTISSGETCPNTRPLDRPGFSRGHCPQEA